MIAVLRIGVRMTSKRVVLLLSRFALTAAVATVFPASSQAVAQQPYSVLTKWAIGGEGGWDYLAADPAAHRLYITHATRVEVLDADTGKSVGSITGFKGLHGIAFDTNGKFGYVK